jgi:hypothetical protein
MVHQSDPNMTPTIKQVEFNTIASSFGGLSAQTSRLHRYVLFNIAKIIQSLCILHINHVIDIVTDILH